MTNDFVFGELTYYLRGAGFRIHNALKGGHKESVYEEALVWVLEQDGVSFFRQKRYAIEHRNKEIGHYYPDLMLEDEQVAIDLKAAQAITPLHKAQVLSYVAITSAVLGFIMNFGSSSFESERLPNYLDSRKSFQWQQTIPDDMIYPELTSKLMELLHRLHYELGPGFLSQIYRRATRIELAHEGINAEYLKELPLQFEGQSISIVPTRLFWIDEKVLLATFAESKIARQHSEKMRWAMQELGCRLGLIANFYPSRLDIRFIRGGK